MKIPKKKLKIPKEEDEKPKEKKNEGNVALGCCCFVFLILIVVIVWAVVSNKKSSDTAPTFTPATTLTPTPKPAEKTNDTLEHQLAIINKGGYVKDSDITINRFRFLLEEIDNKTVDDKQSVSDKTVKGWQLVKSDFGKDISLLDFMEQANDSIPTGRNDWKYEEIVAPLIILLGRS